MFNFNAGVDDVELAAELASMIEMLDVDDWLSRMYNERPDLTRDSTAWFPRDHNEQAPRIMKIDVQQGTLILVQGVKRSTTALQLMQAYGIRPRQSYPAGINEQVLRAVLDLNNPLWNSPFGLRENILIAGHSYGGAVAFALAANFKNASPDKNVRVITFGSPKIGNFEYVAATSTIPHMRWWNEDDPIRMVCPSRLEGAGAHAAVSSQTSYLWWNYLHTGNGASMNSVGNCFRRSSLPEGDRLSVVNLVGWATGLLTAPVQAHSIAEYRRRLWMAQILGVRLTTDRPGTVYRPRRPTQEVPQPMPADVPEVAAAIAAVQVAVVAERGIPLPTTFIADQRNGEWGVWRGDDLVTFCQTRTRARSIARTGNSIMRDMQARGAVDEEALRTVLAAMLR